MKEIHVHLHRLYKRAVARDRRARDAGELFSLSHLSRLREEFSKLNTIDPSLPSYQKLVGTLGAMSQEQLKQVATANIKFLSSLARNRIRDKMPTVDAYKPQEKYWTYRSEFQTPTVEEAIKLGMIHPKTTEKEWSSLSPGMRREIVRSGLKSAGRDPNKEMPRNDSARDIGKERGFKQSQSGEVVLFNGEYPQVFANRKQAEAAAVQFGGEAYQSRLSNRFMVRKSGGAHDAEQEFTVTGQGENGNLVQVKVRANNQAEANAKAVRMGLVDDPKERRKRQIASLKNYYGNAGNMRRDARDAEWYITLENADRLTHSMTVTAPTQEAAIAKIKVTPYERHYKIVGIRKVADARDEIPSERKQPDTQWRVGQNVHMGLAVRGGAGFRGIIKKINGAEVTIENSEGRIFKGSVTRLSDSVRDGVEQIPGKFWVINGQKIPQYRVTAPTALEGARGAPQHKLVKMNTPEARAELAKRERMMRGDAEPKGTMKLVPGNGPKYNFEAVHKAIESANRAGRKIGGREARLIHALLKGHDCSSFKDGVAEEHQKKIAMQTLRMSPAMAGVMGGPNHEQSREILRKAGWSEAKLKAYEGKDRAQDVLRNTGGMTFAQASAEIRAVGCEIKKTEYDEFRVNFRGGKESTAYYTDDLQDAVDTAKAMARKRAA